MLALVGNLFYVLVYTRWLKRSTPQNIVIGGAAGAVPPLVGWAAATGNLTAAGAVPVPDRVLLDTAALLGARARDQARLRGGADPDAPGRARRPRDRPPDRLVLDRARRGDAAAIRVAHGRRALPLGGPAAGSGRSFASPGACAARRRTARAGVLFKYSLLYLALLFVALAVDPLIG